MPRLMKSYTCKLKIRLKNRFHVAVRLFSNRSQMTSKCGKNKKVSHEAIAECVTDVGEHEKTIWRDLLSIQNEAISLVAVGSKELWLVQENHATPRGMNTYSESRIELRNLQIIKKMLEKSSQFLSSEQPCEPKSLDFALYYRSRKNILGKIVVAVNLEAIWFEFWMKAGFVMVEIFVICGWWFSNQFDIMLETSFSCITVVRELCRVNCT